MNGLWLALALAIAAPVLAAQDKADADRVTRAVRGEAIRAHLGFLADDLLEGRAPGTRGDRIAIRYLVAQFRRLALEPAGDSGTYIQRVPLVGLRVRTSSIEFGREGDTLRHQRDVLLHASRAEPTALAAGELVFVGFGIVAPEYGWDDYGDIDVTGKIVLTLAGSPELLVGGRVRPAGPEYGSRSYKTAEAARRGAAGVLVIHTGETIGVPWDDLAASWGREDLRLEEPPNSVRVSGWVSHAAGDRLLRRGGSSLVEVMRLAASRGFRPIALRLRARAVVRSDVRHIETANVLARLPGRSQRDEAVVVGAHFDHLGIGPAVAGDSIYNGAQDNASGTAALLAMAEAFARSGVRPERSIVFAAFGAEEAGLLGSRAFLARSTIPPDQIAGMLNFDAINLAGRTRDAAALGLRHSSLGAAFRRAAAAERLRVPEEISPVMESFFARSDQLAFAEAGVPALFIWFGTDFAGRPPEYARQRFDEYFARRYHQPGDEILPWHTMEGAVQQIRVAARLALDVANASELPVWNAESQFGGRERPPHSHMENR